MSSLNGRKVVVIRLHTSVHIVDVGQLGPAMSGTDLAKKGIEATKIEGGVNLKGRTFEAFIPDGNISLIQFASEKNS